MVEPTLTAEVRSSHGKQRALLDTVAEGRVDPHEQPDVLAKVVLETVRHLVHERLILVPATRRALGDEAARACEAALVRLRQQVERLEAEPVDGPGFPDALQGLTDELERHVRWQEGELLPDLEAAMETERLAAAAGALDPTEEVGPTASHPDGFYPAQVGWPAPGLTARLERLLVEDATRRGTAGG